MKVLTIELICRVRSFFTSAIAKPLIATAMLVVSANASADYLVMDGTVTGIANTSSNQANFAVRVSGGSLNLCEGIYIKFPEADAANKEAHARAYATALAALTAGLPVRIYSYVGNACDRAAYIEIRR